MKFIITIITAFCFVFTNAQDTIMYKLQKGNYKLNLHRFVESNDTVRNVKNDFEVNTHLEGDLRIPNYKHLNIPIPDTYKRLDTSYAIIVYVVELAGSPLDLKAEYGMVIDTLIREDWVPYNDPKNSNENGDQLSIATLRGVPIYEQYKIIAGNKAVPLDMVVAIIPKQKPKK